MRYAGMLRQISIGGCLLGPGVVATFEAATRVPLLKRPPCSHPGELATTQTIGLAVGGNGGEEVEEVEDDAGAGAILDTEGDEGLERVAGEVRVCGGVLVGGCSRDTGNSEVRHVPCSPTLNSS